MREVASKTDLNSIRTYSVIKSETQWNWLGMGNENVPYLDRALGYTVVSKLYS